MCLAICLRASGSQVQAAAPREAILGSEHVGTRPCTPAPKCRFWSLGWQGWPAFPKGYAWAEGQGQPLGVFISQGRHSLLCAIVGEAGRDRCDGVCLGLGFGKWKAVFLGHAVVFAGRSKGWPTPTWFGVSVHTRVHVCLSMSLCVMCACLCSMCMYKLHV